jgi:hypothetical protein
METTLIDLEELVQTNCEDIYMLKVKMVLGKIKKIVKHQAFMKL